MSTKKPSRKNKATFSADEQTFRLMFEGHSAIMLLIEPETGIILDANQSAVDFYGYSKSKLCGISIHEINVLASEQVTVEHQKIFNEEQNHAIFSHKLASGEERIVEVYSSSIGLQERQVLFSIVHDITRHKQAEKALSVEQYLMDALMHNVPAHIYFKDRESRFIRINNAQSQSFGLTDPKQAIGKTDFDFFTNEHAQQAYEDEQEIIRTEQPINKEEKETRQGLPDKWVSTTKLPLRDKDTKIIGTFGISVDITERIQVDEALNESKLLFHLLIESLPQNIYAKDVNGRFIFANQHYCTTQDKYLEEIVGKTDFDLHPPEMAEKYLIDDIRVIETGKTIELEEEHQPLGKEKFYVQVIKTPFYYSEGQPAGVLGIFWDITERKQAENALLESEKRFRSLIEKSPLAIGLSRNGLGLYMNPRFVEMFGLSSEQEMRGRPVFEFFAPEYQEASKQRAHRRELGLPVPAEFESVGIRADGSKFLINLVSVQIQLEDGPANLSFITDITERKQAEAELRNAKDELEAAHRQLQQSFEREQRLAHTDELTGINNHRFLLQLIEHEFNSAMRYKTPLSMMFFDIDYFKQINDTFGHAMGDQVLKKIIQVVCAELRSADVIGRYGGDEFIILLPQTSVQESLSLAERIHASVAAMRMHTDKGPLSLTISIGIAQTIQNITQPDLLLRADQALYAAKQGGRNRTEVFTSE